MNALTFLEDYVNGRIRRERDFRDHEHFLAVMMTGYYVDLDSLEQCSWIYLLDWVQC